MKRFIYNWREWGLKLAWSMLTKPKTWEPVPSYPTWEQVSALELSATEAERNRIIKLLETTYNEIIDELGVALVKRELDLLLKLIALIKGEK